MGPVLWTCDFQTAERGAVNPLPDLSAPTTSSLLSPPSTLMLPPRPKALAEDNFQRIRLRQDKMDGRWDWRGQSHGVALDPSAAFRSIRGSIELSGFDSPVP